jgi:hyperosmotically inducible protein
MLSAVAPFKQKDSRTLRVEADVQRELFQLPYYTIFDFLAFRVEPGGTLRLLGQVVRPTLKDDAERRVKGIEGIDKVINDIEVLPVSPADGAIRIAVARNIYRSDALDRYGFGSQPSIRIIVKTGASCSRGRGQQGDKSVAGIKAREVNGVFEVRTTDGGQISIALTTARRRLAGAATKEAARSSADESFAVDNHFATADHERRRADGASFAWVSRPSCAASSRRSQTSRIEDNDVGIAANGDGSLPWKEREHLRRSSAQLDETGHRDASRAHTTVVHERQPRLDAGCAVWNLAEVVAPELLLLGHAERAVIR